MHLRLSLTLVVLLSFVCLTLVAPCLADDTGTDGDPKPGDPSEELPLCTAKDSLDPTAGTFGEVWMILMAMAFQLAL
jgi:hypothetical protein